MPDALYAAFTQRLFAQNQFTIKLGLDNMRAALQLARDPQHSFSCVTVAGTNGKGTTCSLLANLLQASGACVGLYSSPHLVDLRERFRVQGQIADAQSTLEIGAAALLRFGGDPPMPEALRCLGEASLRRLGWDTDSPAPTLTFFELTTLMALELFRQRGVQLAIMEVGLGGRLDATNALEPALTGVARIGLDHQQYLGDTLALIAAEKAAIARAGRPCVVAPQAPQAQASIQQVLQRIGALPVEATTPEQALPGWLQGDFGDNAALALGLWHQARRLGLVEISPVDVSQVLEQARWPGRRDLVTLAGRPWLLDVAHNPQGIESVLQFLALRGAPAPQVGLLGMMGDKDVDGVAQALARLPRVRWVVTCAQTPRAMPAQELSARLRAAGVQVLHEAQALPEALALLPPPPQEVLVCGSVYLLGELLEHLNAPEGFFGLRRAAL